MSDISKIDKNFTIPATIDKEDVVFYNVKENDWCLYGLMYDETQFFRMDKSVAEKISQSLIWLNENTSGGRLRFVTDSDYIAISCRTNGIARPNNMTLTGAAGFDIYGDNFFSRPLVPPPNTTKDYDTYWDFPDKGTREITINFPLYNNVADVYIGLQKNAVFKPAKPYTYQKPVVFYGSSITQGGCASRPGLQYTSILSRALDFDYINLGFSGNAKGEPEIAEYLASLDMSVFVLDYDHNAPTVEYLQNTHENVFLTVRKKHPEMPIIMITKPDFGHPAHGKEGLENSIKRRAVVYQTYQNALARGDKNVYFIDGETFFKNEHDRADCTFDGCHPNDLGFHLMAKTIKPVLKQALESIK